MLKMSKFSRILVATLLAVAMLLTLSACGGGGGGGGDGLQGTWEGSSEDQGVTWVFDGKGGCKIETEFGFKSDGTYTVDGSKVTIELEDWDDAQSFEFKVDGDKLSLENNDKAKPDYELEKK